jgi:hypothetical protein
VCILLILRDRVEGWPLVVGSNRDEYRDRPWDPPALDDEILAPRDRVAGGTWIGLTRTGLLVALTNRSEADPDPARPSRGLLALDLLRAGALPRAIEILHRDRLRRNAYQVLVASAEGAFLGVHPGEEHDVDILEVPDGLHTLTNRRGPDELDHGGALDPVDLPRGTDLDIALGRMRDVLALHEDRGPGEPDVICKHGIDRGTLSSTIVALPVRDDVDPVFLMALGAPCETEFEEHGGELGPRRLRPIP